MKNILFIIALIISPVSQAAEKSYDSYNDIVDKLSAERNQRILTKMPTILALEERFHLILGLSNSSTNIEHANVGTVSQNGFLFGAAVPMISGQLYAEGFAKFFNAARESDSSTSLRQFEARISHKEPLSFAIWNMGVGGSVRFMEVESNSNTKSIRTPNFVLTTGFERNITQRVSVAGDLGYHRSLQSDVNGKNSFEFILRMNYHL